MPGEIAEAFVLIRPNTTGFKQQVEGESKSAALGAAKVFAAAFAGVKLFDFAKDVVKEAAQTQKAIESVKANFRGASDDVLKFGDDAASSLGIAREDSLRFSGNFAIAARNLGIGREKAAEMAIGFQKVAGTLGQIKGIDPASVFDKLQLALLGNTRGLKSLGIAVDANSIKQAALDAGVVKATVNEAAVTKAQLAHQAALKDLAAAQDKYGAGSAQVAEARNKVALSEQAVQKAQAGSVPTLTAAQKAEAIYAAATKHLGEFQGEAKKHGDDLFNTQLKLSAEWKNLQADIGEALLPAITALAGGFIQVVEAVQRNEGGIKRAFGDAAEVLSPVTFLVQELADHAHETVPVILGLAGAFAAYKVTVFAANEAQALYTAALGAYRVAAAVAQGQTDLLANSKLREAVASGDAAAADTIRATSAEAAAAALEAENVATSQAVIALGLYQAALDGGVSAQTGFVLGSEALAAAQANLAVAEEASTVATVELDAALASNPFGLLAVGVSAVVGGLIGYKTLAAESAGETDSMTQAFKDAKSASQDLAAALEGLKTGHLDLKQATLDHARAAETLAGDQRKVTALVRDGKKGTQEYGDAVRQVNQDEIDLARTNQEKQRALGEIADNTEKARKATSDYEDSLVKAGQAAEKGVQADKSAALYKDRLASAATRTAHQQQIEQRAVDQYVTSASGMADVQGRIANDLNNKFSPAQQEAARRSTLLALAAQGVAREVGHIPTKHQIDVYYKNNMALLQLQANTLKNDILNIPSNKSVTISIFEHHAAEEHRTAAAGGGLGAGEVSLTGEQGPEISVASTGRQIISHSQSVSLFTDLAKSIDRLSALLAPRAQPSVAAGPGVVVEHLEVNQQGGASKSLSQILDDLAVTVPR